MCTFGVVNKKPKDESQKGVKRIVISLKQKKVNRFDCQQNWRFDFAGYFNKGKITDPQDCLSLIGYVVEFVGFPRMWSLKLQTKIVLYYLQLQQNICC